MRRLYSRQQSGQGTKVTSEIDYNINALKAYLSETGKMLPGRITGVQSSEQRKIKRAILTARFLALLPYCDSHR